MRTNIEIDDEVLEEARKATKIKTKRKLVDTALRELVKNHKRLDLRDLRGKVQFAEDYDHKAMRKR